MQYASCCHPIPGDRIVGYLGRGEGLVVHTDDCPTGKKLLHRDSERFLDVEWSEAPVRLFESAVLVTIENGKGVLAKVASAFAAAEADINHIHMNEDALHSAADLHFLIAVRDRVHLAHVLRALKRTPSVVRAHRVHPTPKPR